MATVATTEQIAAAVFNLVSVAAGSVVGLVTSARHFRMPRQVDAAQMPALFQIQTGEEYERTQGGTFGIRPKRTMHFEISLYVADSQEENVVPSTSLNLMRDAIEAAFEAAVDQTTQFCTLGGLVKSARIRGKIDYAENLTGDGKSLAVIPIEVIRP
jgi:hypothetical protein